MKLYVKKGLVRSKNNKTLAIEYVISKLEKGGQLIMTNINEPSPPTMVIGEVTVVRPRSPGGRSVNFDDNITEYSADTIYS